MLKWIKELFVKKHWGDLSQHRVHVVTDKKFRYEDLCM